MIFFGNLMLGIAALLYSVLLFSLYSRPAPGGDASVGHAYAIVFGNLLLLGCFAAATIAIGMSGGFQWVGGSGGSRFLKVTLGLLFIVLVLAVSAMGQNEGPSWLRLIFMFGAFVLPAVVILACATLLNEGLRENLPTHFAQWSLKGTAGLGALMVAGFLLQQTASRLSATFRHLNRDPNELSDFEQGILQNIENCDLQKDMIFLMVHTDRNRNPIVREKAIAKVKTRPDWQEELVRRLDTGWAEDVFTFLASNEVDDKSLFPEAVRKGILQQSTIIRERIRQGGSFRGVGFDGAVRNVLTTVEKYVGMGVDFRPAIKTLRDALNGPPEAKEATAASKKALDNWLTKH
ncbi:MAG: hypothetical protein IT270_09190 [Saprospiraceae bacterium]|nr:hypothetical protein [Saprospiraceae bacterium]